MRKCAANRTELKPLKGVPMGGELALTSSTCSHFLAIASQDPGTSSRPGSALQQMQIIKVWPGKNNQLHQKVIGLAGENIAANVDSNTCQQFGQGHVQFCRVWKILITTPISKPPTTFASLKSKLLINRFHLLQF